VINPTKNPNQTQSTTVTKNPNHINTATHEPKNQINHDPLSPLIELSPTTHESTEATHPQELLPALERVLRGEGEGREKRVREREGNKK